MALRIIFHDRHNRGRIHETRKVIGVAVGVIAGDSIFQPKNICDAKVFAKNVGVIVFGESGIAFLNFAEQAFFGGEKRSTAVHVDAAAFEDYAAALVLWLPDAPFQLLVGFGDDGGVFFVIWVLCPAVKEKIVVGDFAGFVSNADWAGITHPSAICGDAKEIHGVKICFRFFQHGSNARFGGAVFNEEKNALDARQVANDFREGPRNNRKFPGPVGYLVRPAEPGGFVRLPFGGHSEAEGKGSRRKLNSRHRRNPDSGSAHMLRPVLPGACGSRESKAF